MNLIRIVSLLSCFSAFSSYAAEMLMYDCQGENLDVTLMIFFEDDDPLFQLTRDNQEFEASNVTVTDTATNYNVVAVVKTLGTFAFSVEKIKDPNAEANENGFIQYDQTSSSTIVLTTSRGESSTEITCKPYGINKKFFDIIGSCIP